MYFSETLQRRKNLRRMVFALELLEVVGNNICGLPKNKRFFRILSIFFLMFCKETKSLSKSLQQFFRRDRIGLHNSIEKRAGEYRSDCLRFDFLFLMYFKAG